MTTNKEKEVWTDAFQKFMDEREARSEKHYEFMCAVAQELREEGLDIHEVTRTKIWLFDKHSSDIVIDHGGRRYKIREFEGYLLVAAVTLGDYNFTAFGKCELADPEVFGKVKEAIVNDHYRHTWK